MTKRILHYALALVGAVVAAQAGQATDATFAAALRRCAAIRSESVAHGFTAGALFWTYDTEEQPTLWHARADWRAFTAALPPLATATCSTTSLPPGSPTPSW